jgi:uncharacterized protein (TIGR02271 family)
MITKEQVPTVLGHTAYDGSHKRIGTVEHVYLDKQTGQPEWLTVRTGLFGMKETFVPSASAEVRGEELVVPFTKDQIRNAPMIDLAAGEEVPADKEAQIYAYYGMQYEPTGKAGTYEQRGGEAMTRAEEELHVGKETRETGHARLRKYVTTEEQQMTVPVTKEKARVEHESITEADKRSGGPQISEAEQEVTLHEERPVVSKETKPVERVRLAKDKVTEQEAVRGQVRKEHIEAQGETKDKR